MSKGRAVGGLGECSPDGPGFCGGDSHIDPKCDPVGDLFDQVDVHGASGGGRCSATYSAIRRNRGNLQYVRKSRPHARLVVPRTPRAAMWLAYYLLRSSWGTIYSSVGKVRGARCFPARPGHGKGTAARVGGENSNSSCCRFPGCSDCAYVFKNLFWYRCRCRLERNLRWGLEARKPM